MIKIKSDKIVLLDSIYDGYIYIDHGFIVEISKNDKEVDYFYDFTGKYVTPGFIEMHTHGGGGHPFIGGTVEDIIEACNFHLKHGTTSIIPTITTSPFEEMKDATLKVIQAMSDNGLQPHILGVHLEGPYLSKEQSGAQCVSFFTKPNKNDYQPLIDKYGKYIKKWTYAPENDDGYQFTDYLVKHGIIASIGHSNATYTDCLNAFNHGANMITHLYSCTSTIKREKGYRILGINEAAYLIDDLYVEIIADGVHLPDELIKLIIKNKGVDKIVAVSDSLEIAGTNNKEGIMSEIEFVVEDGVAKLKDRSAFAGSIATGDILLKTLLRCGVSINDAIKMMSYNPAKLLKINKGEIKVGLDADIVVFDNNVNIIKTFVSGK